jgi:hypothetical protein
MHGILALFEWLLCYAFKTKEMFGGLVVMSFPRFNDVPRALDDHDQRMQGGASLISGVFL